MTGYDELLHARVEQLRRIEERLDDIAKKLPHQSVMLDLYQLRCDLRDMIAAAERDHAEF